MNEIEIKVKAEPGVEIPCYKTSGAAGADIQAHLSEPVVIKKGCRAMIPTGLYFEIPEGYEIQVSPRSGLSAKNGVTVLNTPGTIDSDYRGEVKVILINLGDEDFVVNDKERIAQIIVAPVTIGKFKCVSELASSERGAGGFGSTGVK